MGGGHWCLGGEATAACELQLGWGDSRDTAAGGGQKVLGWELARAVESLYRAMI